MVTWIAYATFKATGSFPTTILAESPHIPFTSALAISSSFIIGYAVWGNEPDYWRYGKPKKRFSLIPVGIALLIGEILFPIAGWLLARTTGITDSIAATNLLNQYSLGGISWLAALMLAITLIAANDSVLFGSITAFENLWPLKHKVAVAFMTLIGVCLAAWFASFGFIDVFQSVASLNCILLPTPTVIMFTECFLLARIFHTPPDFSTVPKFESLPFVRWPALVALFAGWMVGIATSGIIPGTAGLRIGVCSLQAWLTALVVYVPLRIVEHQRSLAFERSFSNKLLVQEALDRETAV
jgi:hypothetical protein